MRIVTVVGTRPQFIKAAAVSRALARHTAVAEEILVHTGQHYDHSMSAAFFAELGLGEPAYHLGVGSGSHAYQTSAMLVGLERVVSECQPDVVLVYGDTNSTLAGALVAAKASIRLAHVEAGLRSGNRTMPEEINRLVTDGLSQHLYCPSAVAVENLASEGITAGVHLVGDVMLDVMLWTLDGAAPSHLTPGHDYALATIHRGENVDNPVRLRGILNALAAISAGGVGVVLPLHPRTAKALGQWTPPPGVVVTDPLSHAETMRLALGAQLVLTDSGGLQKEAYWLGVPCVTMRDETEWVETVAAGWNTLAGADEGRILAAATRALRSPARPDRVPLYGDGTAAEAVVRDLVCANS